MQQRIKRRIGEEGREQAEKYGTVTQQQLQVAVPHSDAIQGFELGGADHPDQGHCVNQGNQKQSGRNDITHGRAFEGESPVLPNAWQRDNNPGGK